MFRCVSIRENDDGTYAITAVQHVPEKEAIVDNGAHFDGDQSGTVNGVTPPAVQHLTAEVTADSGEYQVLARWDTPKVVKGVSFMLRLTVAADDGSERLVSTARTTETTYRFTQLALGNYRLTVRAANAWGQQGDPASVSFRIAAPAAPSRIELTPGYFQITATPHLAVYDPTVQFEFWFSEKRIADIRQVETSARYLGTALYWIAASINIKPGHDYYFYTVRVYDDQPFDRQIVIPAVAFSGAKHEQDHTDIYSSCRLIVRKNGAEIYNRTALDNTLIYTGVIDMPAGSGVMTLEFSVSAWLVNGWYPTASISDLLVVVMKKATAGIMIS
ncbi:TPA: hypothetical protein KHA21_003580 [Escherichia coli]|nr:hypothetical protein [Escherichia coli]EHU9110418.1 hypothetical protein [Escherichia coli]EHU9139403.1 hypothetical protein [Escherichia coli]EHV0104650.1 hypothetical protein [Escherichia coli]EIA9464179.1 hypothetical protein [Escherichia coli]